MQFEGILRVIPDNEAILAQLAQAYVAYAYGWVEADVEELEFEGEYDQADVQRRRTRTMYLRALDLTRHCDSAAQRRASTSPSKGTVEELEDWLAAVFVDRGGRRDAPLARVRLGLVHQFGAKDDMEAVADLEYAKAFVSRSIELDPNYYHAAGYTFMGVAVASEMAGDMDDAKVYFEKAMARTERRALAGSGQHGALLRGERPVTANSSTSSSTEVMDAHDPLPEARLANVMARQRAAMYIENADQLF